ncbi:uncharacterized protein TRIADDRAFT_55020 [Trichoplax adhaerens]|uniref:Kinase n=1 Tax=Trichoplax adhaerens TaxID=10228 RepID=B3RQK3_TRIAD|nr:hypothetical protein TRIADDRAFT_55020 [Trichoplax adhaerens]EDV27261.1 hypothetical protein TRIADDRAFT_55020 [Trichoplax adhaerens]|eukprot:XP_002111257.1 hypothetical protein TRIADDRAFT_55020 [Trichoplax adhaerens]
MDAGESPSSGTIVNEFFHRVGGHNTIYLFDETTICKALLPREFYFYKRLKNSLRSFIPDYKGIVKIDMKDEERIRAYRVTEADLSATDLDFTKEYFSPEIVNDIYKKEESCDTSKSDKEINQQTTSKGPECSSQGLADTDKLEYSAYILLENVSSKFINPCILDLKMGTRQHGDTASSVKAQKQMERTKSTTSSKLGVRMCGMQIYSEAERAFRRRDKYYCRSLSVEGFKHHLYEFLCNGTDKLRVDVCIDFLQRLKEMKQVIEEHRGYRFFSSSLLFIYEGQLDSPGKNRTNKADIDIRIIDLAHTTCDRLLHKLPPYEGPDEGFLKGLQNIYDFLYEFVERERKI